MGYEKFKISPAAMSEAEFVDVFGGVYEHSPWVPKQTYQKDLSNVHSQVCELAKALAETVDQADKQKRHELIVAHPDLAGKAAQQGALTKESTSEQAGAGIDQCTPEEFEQFQSYNSAYKDKFGIPFVMAVKGSNRHLILAAFKERLENDLDTEYARAISEIHKIARFRLDVIAEEQAKS